MQSAILRDLTSLDSVWRIVAGLGALPVVGALLLRIKLPESPRFTIEINNNPTLAKSNMQVPSPECAGTLSRGVQADWTAADRSPSACNTCSS